MPPGVQTSVPTAPPYPPELPLKVVFRHLKLDGDADKDGAADLLTSRTVAYETAAADFALAIPKCNRATVADGAIVGETALMDR